MKFGRNDPCPCGSGKKYKKCCIDKDLPPTAYDSSHELDEQDQEIKIKSYIDAILFRDIHFNGIWKGVLEHIIKQGPDFEFVTKATVQELIQLEKEENAPAADLLDEQDKAIIAREKARIQRFREQRDELKNKSDRTREEDIQYHIAQYFLDPFGNREEFRQAMLRHGDACVDALAHIATCGKYEYYNSAGMGEAAIDAVRILGELKAGRAAEKLCALLDNEGDMLRDAASDALAEIGGPAAVDSLLPIARTLPPSFRSHVALETLSNIQGGGQRVADMARETLETIREFPHLSYSDEAEYFSFFVDLLFQGDAEHAKKLVRSLLDDPDFPDRVKYDLTIGYDLVNNEDLDFDGKDEAAYSVLDMPDSDEDDLPFDEEDEDGCEEIIDEDEWHENLDGILGRIADKEFNLDDFNKQMAHLQSSVPYIHEVFLLRWIESGGQIASPLDPFDGINKDLYIDMMRQARDGSPKHRARETALSGFTFKDYDKRMKMARQALDLDPECADAYTLLGCAESNMDRAIRWYRRAIALAEKGLEPATPANPKLSGWWDLNVRPVMRVYRYMAECLIFQNKERRAIEYLQNLLSLDDSDPTFARLRLFNLFILLDDNTSAAETLDRIALPESPAWVSFGKALVSYRTHGDSENSRAILAQAVAANPFVPQFFLNEIQFNESSLDLAEIELVQDAVDCVDTQVDAWLQTPGALAWLAIHSDT